MLLIIDPNDSIESRYSNNNQVIFFQAEGNLFFRFIEGKKVEYRNYAECSELISDIDMPIERIVKKIDEWSPIWSRWVGQSDQYELMKRDALYFVINFGCFLRAQNINSVIFFTGVSHHVIYSLIEIACQISKIEQIFLYCTSFGDGGRLLPMRQVESILDRRPLGFEISSVNMKEVISNFTENAKLGRAVGSEKTTKLSFSDVYAKIFLVKKSVRFFLKTIIVKCKKIPFGNTVPIFPDHSFLAQWRMIRNQTDALKFYRSKVLPSEKLNDLIDSNEILPLIAAHYQPEATTFPEGWSCRDHVDMVLEIRRLGYKGLILYKEHPSSSIIYSKIVGLTRCGMARSVGYYRKLLDLGCVFVPSDFSINIELPNSIVILTITGSIALERAFLGKSTCCAGRPWFFGLPGTYSLKETFGPNGLFIDSTKRLFDCKLTLDFMNTLLGNKTLTNAMGIGSGIVSKSEDDHLAFGREFDCLVNELIKRKNNNPRE
jgi:hypothetical protein